MSDKVLELIINLASEGYDVRFLDFYGNAIEIRVCRNNLKAARVLSIDEIRQSKFDVIYYAINRLVEVVNGHFV